MLSLGMIKITTMTTDVKENKLTDEQRKYKLCYVEEIPEMYYDLDEKSKELVASGEYKEYLHKKHAWINEQMNAKEPFSVEDIMKWENENNYRDFELSFKFYDTQEYKDGFTHWFHFTNDMEKQWGDDWDCLLESSPYDNDTEVVRMPIRLPKEWLEETGNVKVASPTKYTTDNFDVLSVDMVNHHAMPWMWISVSDHINMIVKSVSIMAGDTPDDVMRKIKEIEDFINNKK